MKAKIDESWNGKKTAIQIWNEKNLLVVSYKFLNGLPPPMMKEVFQINECPYNLRLSGIIISQQKSAIKHATDTIAFKGPKIWQSIL